MYVLQAGKVRISKQGKDGEKTLAILGAGEFFGEMAILNNKPRTATAETVEDSKLLLLDARTFEQMVVSNSEIAVRLIKKLARRLDAADNLIDILMHRDPKARVILGLSRAAELQGRQRDDGATVISMERAELAHEVGLSDDEVGAVLARLGRLSIVEEAQEGFVIPDLMRLHEFLEFLEMREKFGDA